MFSLLLGWIGFGVPDWQAFRRYNNSIEEYYGLWAYCQETDPYFSSTCKRWPTAANELFNGTRPNFVVTAEGLITTGMILLSLGLITAVTALILPLLAYLAAVLTFLDFLFLVIGLPIFGKQSNDLSVSQGDASYNKRYGFWLIVPTIVLSFLAMVLFGIAGFLYQKFGFGNIATHAYSRRPNAYGGQRLLGPANALYGMPYAARPGLYGAGGMVYPYQPSLLSQYIAQRMSQSAPVVVQRPVVSQLPQPSIIPIVSRPAYVTPAYYSAPTAQATYAPLINLTGRTLVGPPVRNAQYTIYQ